MINKPHVDWFALSPSLAMIGAAGLLLLVAVFVPKRVRKQVSATTAGAGFIAAFVLAIVLADKSPHATTEVVRLDLPRPLGGRRTGADRGLRCRRGADLLRRALARRARRRVLRAARRGRRRDGVLRAGLEPDDALPRARVVLDLALRALRDRHRPGRVARGRAQVPDHRRGRLGDAALRLGTRLRDDRPAQLRQDRCRGPLARLDARARARDDRRRARVQDLGGAVPHVDARRLHRGADPGDRFHVVGDQGRRARRHLPAAADRIPRRTSACGHGRSPASRSPRSRSGTSRRSCSAT